MDVRVSETPKYRFEDLRDILNSLSLAVAGLGRHCPSSSSAIIETTAAPVFVEAAPTLVVAEILVAAATATHATSLGHVTSIGVRTRATLFDEDLFSTDVVRICCNSSIVCGRVCVFDESTVLDRISQGRRQNVRAILP